MNLVKILVDGGARLGGGKDVIKKAVWRDTASLPKPFVAEYPPVERRGQHQEQLERPAPVVGGGLGGMGGHGGPLGSDVASDVHFVGQLHPVGVGGRQPVGLPFQGGPAQKLEAAQPAQQPEQCNPVDGGFEDDRRCGYGSSPDTDAMDLNMVGVAIAASRVVDGEHVGIHGPQYLGQPGCGLLNVDPGERRPIPSSLAVHSGVVVAEQPHVPAAEKGGRGAKFAHTTLRQAASLGYGHRGETSLAGGGRHHNDSMPLAGGLGQGPGGEQRFVVGVGVERHDRVGHRTLVTR
jgi:hypothetical protein